MNLIGKRASPTETGRLHPGYDPSMGLVNKSGNSCRVGFGALAPALCNLQALKPPQIDAGYKLENSICHETQLPNKCPPQITTSPQVLPVEIRGCPCPGRFRDEDTNDRNCDCRKPRSREGGSDDAELRRAQRSTPGAPGRLTSPSEHGIPGGSEKGLRLRPIGATQLEEVTHKEATGCGRRRSRRAE